MAVSTVPEESEGQESEMTTLRCIDTETTGLEPSDEVVEVGFCDLFPDMSAVDMESGVSFLVRPARPIPAQASAVHHIVDSDVKDKPTWADSWLKTLDGKSADGFIFVAHNSQFERTHFDPLFTARWIDTWRAALRQWPEQESHSLQFLRYSLRLDVDCDIAFPPHRALADAYVCGVLLVELLKCQTVETLLKWSNERPVFGKLNFGQHRGTPVTEVADDYLKWLATGEHQLSEDWRWTAEQEIKRRADVKAQEAAREAQERDAAVAAFMSSSTAGIASAATVADLEHWFYGTMDVRERLGITVDTPEYGRLIEACAARKAALLQAGEPQFETRSA